MRLVFVILALAAAFIGTIFAFRAIQRIHDGQEFRYEMIACAICATLITFCLRRTRNPRGACSGPAGVFIMLISYLQQRRVL